MIGGLAKLIGTLGRLGKAAALGLLGRSLTGIGLAGHVTAPFYLSVAQAPLNAKSAAAPLSASIARSPLNVDPTLRSAT